MSQSARPIPEVGFDALTDRLRNSLSCDDGDAGNINKPDFRELDLGSPVSPLRTRPSGLTTTTTSSSSSSSGSASGRNGLSPVTKRSDSGGNSHSGELSGSVESCPTAAASSGFKPGHTRSDSGGYRPPCYSGGSSVTSTSVNVLPTGNICPSGRILKMGMASRSSKTEVLGSGTGNYGHGSIMRGGISAKSGSGVGGGDAGVVSGTTNSWGSAGGVPFVRRAMSSIDPEELKRAGNEQHKRGHFAEALSLYERAIAISPGNAACHCNRAAALIGLKRLAEAVMECEEAIRLDPGYVRAHHRLGSLLLRWVSE